MRTARANIASPFPTSCSRFILVSLSITVFLTHTVTPWFRAHHSVGAHRFPLGLLPLSFGYILAYQHLVELSLPRLPVVVLSLDDVGVFRLEGGVGRDQ